MKKHIWTITLAVGAAFAFVAAGVLGMVIEAILHSTQPFTETFWVFFCAFTFGLIVFFITIFRSQMYKVCKYLKLKVLSVWNVNTHIKEADELLIMKGVQYKNPKYWLYPIIA